MRIIVALEQFSIGAKTETNKLSRPITRGEDDQMSQSG